MTSKALTAVVALAALTGLALVWFLARPAGTPLGFPLDDAWIHLVYARSFSSDFSLSYNAGEPTTGCTSPLWAILLGVGHLLLQHPGPAGAMRLSIGLGGFLHVLSAVTAARLAARLSTPSTGLIAGLTVALCPQLCAAALSGMEVALTSVLLLWGLSALYARRWPQAGIWLGLAPLARPEAALASFVAVLFALQVEPKLDPGSRLKRLAWLVIPALLCACWVVSRDLAWTGHALPATFYAKAHVALPDLPLRLWRSLSRNLGAVPPLWSALNWFALAGLWRGDHRFRMPLWLGLTFILASAVATDPGDPHAFYFLRYQLPAVPLLVLSLVLGAQSLGRRMPDLLQRLPMLVLAAVTVTGIAATLPSASWRLANDTRNIDEIQATMGRWLADHMPKDAKVAAVDSGAVRYLSDRWTLDLLGLNTPEMLWNPDEFARTHPVDVLAWMPNAMKSPEDAPLHEVWRRTTAPYSVLNASEMATQAIALCDRRSQQPIRLQGYFPTQLWCRGL